MRFCAGDERVQRLKELLADLGVIPLLLDGRVAMGRRQKTGDHDTPIFLKVEELII